MLPRAVWASPARRLCRGSVGTSWDWAAGVSVATAGRGQETRSGRKAGWPQCGAGSGGPPGLSRRQTFCPAPRPLLVVAGFTPGFTPSLLWPPVATAFIGLCVQDLSVGIADPVPVCALVCWEFLWRHRWAVYWTLGSPGPLEGSVQPDCPVLGGAGPSFPCQTGKWEKGRPGPERKNTPRWSPALTSHWTPEAVCFSVACPGFVNGFGGKPAGLNVGPGIAHPLWS